MRRRSAVVAAAAALTVSMVSGCTATDNGGVVGGGAGSTSQVGPAGALRSQLPPAIAARGVLRMAGDPTRAPLLFYGTGTTTPEGIEWDLAQAIGRKLGVTVTLTALPQTQLGSDLLVGDADVGMSALVDLKVFETEGLDFVDYLTGSTAILVTERGSGSVSRPGDLCGRVVGAVSGTAQEVVAGRLEAACRTSHRPAMAVRFVADQRAAVGLLGGALVDAVLDDELVAQYTAQVSTGPATFSAVGGAFDPLPYGIAIPHKDPQLVSAVQAALRAVIADGEYDEILARWGGTASALRGAPVDAGQ